jgi:regulatory protein YycI of two-component signal transduction system YycFG
MDWNKAKNLTILFLCMLNIFLGSILFANATNYVLSQSSQDLIVSLLSKNNITLYTNMIKDYKPMKNILLKPYLFDDTELTKLFFVDTSFESVSTKDGMFYNNDFSQLYVANNYFVYESIIDIDTLDIFQNSDNEFINYFSTIIPNLFLDRIFDDSDGFILKYRQKYNNHIIESNYLNIYVYNDGILKVESNYSEPIFFDDVTQEISSPDQSLFVLMQYLRSQYEDKDIFVNRIDIVYFDASDDFTLASPHYRFYTSVSNTAILIDAYNSVLVEN